MHHFLAIGQFKQSGNAKFRWKTTILFCVTLKFDWWPWKTTVHLFYAISSFVNHFRAISQTGVTVSKSQIRVKVGDFLSHVILEFDIWPWKTIGHPFYPTSSFVHHFIAICEFKLELQSGHSWIGFWPMWPWPLNFDLDITFSFINGNFMMIWWWEKKWKGCGGQTDWLNHS